jgi:hypothetical protein
LLRCIAEPLSIARRDWSARGAASVGGRFSYQVVASDQPYPGGQGDSGVRARGLAAVRTSFGRDYPVISRRVIATLLAGVPAIALNACGSTQPPDGPATNGAPESTARVEFSPDRSFCEQLPLTDGNLVEQVTQGTLAKVVVQLRNTGKGTALGGSIMPTRIYASGKRVLSWKDTMVDVDVPNDGRWHTFWSTYEVGPGNTLAACEVRLQVDGLVGQPEREIRLADDAGADPPGDGTQADATSSPFSTPAIEYFTSPTGNIVCSISEELAECLVVSREEAISVDLAGVVDEGNVAALSDHGSAPPLGYGESIEHGDIRCTSRRSGMTCSAWEHGFTAARERIRAR